MFSQDSGDEKMTEDTTPVPTPTSPADVSTNGQDKDVAHSNSQSQKSKILSGPGHPGEDNVTTTQHRASQLRVPEFTKRKVCDNSVRGHTAAEVVENGSDHEVDVISNSPDIAQEFVEGFNVKRGDYDDEEAEGEVTCPSLNFSSASSCSFNSVGHSVKSSSPDLSDTHPQTSQNNNNKSLSPSQHDTKVPLIRLSQIKSAYVNRGCNRPATVGQMFALKKRLKESMNGHSEIGERLSPGLLSTGDPLSDHSPSPVLPTSNGDEPLDFCPIKIEDPVKVGNPVNCLPQYSFRHPARLLQTDHLMQTILTKNFCLMVLNAIR